MIAYGTFAHHDPALVQAVSARVLHVPGTLDPQAIANTLWALALLDDLSPPVWNCLLVAFAQAERFNSEHPDSILYPCILLSASLQQTELVCIRESCINLQWLTAAKDA